MCPDPTLVPSALHPDTTPPPAPPSDPAGIGLYHMDDLKNLPGIFRDLLLRRWGGMLLVFNSQGGNAGLALNCAQELARASIPVAGLCIDECSSAAFTLFAGCHRRFVFPHTEFYVHNCQPPTRSARCAIEVAEADVIHTRQVNMGSLLFLTKRLGGTLPEWRARFSAEVAFTGRDLIKNGWAEEAPPLETLVDTVFSGLSPAVDPGQLREESGQEPREREREADA